MSSRKVSRTLGALPKGTTTGSGCSPKPKRKAKPSDLRHKVKRLEKRIAAWHTDSGVRLEILLHELKTARADLAQATDKLCGATRSEQLGKVPAFIGYSASYISVPGAPMRKDGHSTPGAWPSTPSKAWQEAHA